MMPLITNEESTQAACTSADKQFFFEEHAVGCFEGQVPSSPGEYRYIPLSGSGHLRLLEMLVSVGPQRCYYALDGEEQYFVVMKAPNHNVLLVHAHAHVPSMNN